MSELANSILQKYGIADSHYDLGMIFLNFLNEGEKDPLKNLFLEEWRKNNVKFIIATVFVDSEKLPELALRNALDQVNSILNEIEKNKEDVCLITDNKSFKYSQSNNKIGMIISLEGLEPIGEDINLLEIFFKLGVSFSGLVWSRQNAVADGSRFRGRGVNNGLTSFGFDVIEKMQEIGMTIDVSHLNDKGCEDVFENVSKPIIASHSNARAIKNITRNLTDEQAILIKKSNGIIGINGVKPLVTEGYETNEKLTSIARLCDHIDHYKKIIGSQYICLGLDRCDLISSNDLSSPKGEDNSNDTISDYKELETLIGVLLERGYTEDEIGGILSGNFTAFIENKFV